MTTKTIQGVKYTTEPRHTPGRGYDGTCARCVAWHDGLLCSKLGDCTDVIWIKKEQPMSTTKPKEADPTGKSQHEPGAKLDAGKLRPGLVLNGFARALKAVTAVGTYGANKYTDNGWMEVPNGVQRYTDAMHRHLLAEATGELKDNDTELLHAAHAAWNALARLDLMLRQEPHVG